jgi:hypothetical protein
MTFSYSVLSKRGSNAFTGAVGLIDKKNGTIKAMSVVNTHIRKNRLRYV